MVAGAGLDGPQHLALRYEVLDLARVRPADLPEGNLLRWIAAVEQSAHAGALPGLVRELGEWLAAGRFGADTADRLALLLAPVADPERLAEVGDWLVRCESGDRFLARVSSTP